MPDATLLTEPRPPALAPAQDLRSIALLVNPAAGGGRAVRAREPVEAALRALGLDVDSHATASLAHAAVLAREAVAAGRVPVTLSGDGLVGCVAGALADLAPGLTMGLLPGGRGNDFARNAGIPADPVAACAVVGDGLATPVDVGDVDGKPFVGIASVGFDSDANRHANAAPARLGSLVYAYGALRALVGWRPVRFTLELDGEPTTLEGYTVACANGRGYGGGMLMAPDADLADGELDVVQISRCSRAHLLRVLPSVFSGRHVDDPVVSVRRAARVRVDADRPFDVYADGDPIASLPATISCRPAAVRMLLPG